MLLFASGKAQTAGALQNPVSLSEDAPAIEGLLAAAMPVARPQQPYGPPGRTPNPHTGRTSGALRQKSLWGQESRIAPTRPFQASVIRENAIGNDPGQTWSEIFCKGRGQQS